VSAVEQALSDALGERALPVVTVAQAMVEPGVYDDIPADDYHASPGVSKHQLDLLRMKSPAHLKFEREHPRPPTQALRWGEAFHVLVLEGDDAFDQRFAIVPEDAPRRPSERQINAKKPGAATLEAMSWWDEFDAMHEGKVYLKDKPGEDPAWNPSEWDRIRYMRDAVNDHPVASIFLEEGRPEQSVYAVDPDLGLLVRCRTDFWCIRHQTIVDLKMARDASMEAFARAAADYRYHVQDAFYLDVNYYAGRTAHGFMFIVAENTPPYPVACYAITPEWRNTARSMYLRDLERYAQCLNTGRWPAYEEVIRPLELPAYARVARIR